MTQAPRPAGVSSGPAGRGPARLGRDTAFAHSTPLGRNVQPGQVVRNAAGTIVGRLTPDGWLEKHVDPARHKVRTPSGWATDMRHLETPGLRGVRLCLPDGTTLEAPIETWRQHGRLMDRGFGPQVLLVDRYWAVAHPGEPVAEQLALF